VPPVKHSVPTLRWESWRRRSASLYGRTVSRSAPEPDLDQQPRRVRDRLALAAVELFRTQGYVETTIDDIAARAGVGRRTFFRYYRTKDEAIFPDHDRLLLKVRERLLMFPEESGVQATTQAVKIVMREYVDNREVSLLRYRLVNQVPALREREVVSVARYQRAFRERLAEGPDVPAHTRLRAEVIAASVAAAHNQVLRRWLREGGTTDPFDELDAALDYVSRIFDHDVDDVESASRRDEVIVLAFDRSTPTSAVVAELTRARAGGTLRPIVSE
jgi:AcrR family transcriptional regulator